MESTKKPEQIKPNVIFLIGNGYDLYNGLKTSYKDFIYWYIKKVLTKCDEIYKSSEWNKQIYYNDSCIQVHINPSIFDYQRRNYAASNNINRFTNDLFDKTMKNILSPAGYRIAENIKSFMIQQNLTFTISPINTFIFNILFKCEDSDWNGIEQAIYQQLREEYTKASINIDKIKNGNLNLENVEKIKNRIKCLNDSIDCLKEHLLKYLKEQNNPTLEKDVLLDTNVIDWHQNEQRFNSALFLNFNYTNYIEKKLNINPKPTTLKEECQFINIHGSIGDDIDEIIFGIGDEQEDFLKEIESYFGDEWLKPMKSFFYLKNQKYQDLLGFIAKGDYEIYIVGHSCSITDRTLLKMLFENESCKKIHVMHYKGMESYLKTAYNISRNFDDKIKLRQVLQPFDPKLRLNSEN